MEVLIHRWLSGDFMYYLENHGEQLVNIPDEIRKCVVFLQCDTSEGNRIVGTAFVVRLDIDGNVKADRQSFYYVVTARHLISGIRNHSVDGKIQLRLNTKAGPPEIIHTDYSQWLPHPSSQSADVSVLPWEWPQSIALDIQGFPLKSAIGLSEAVRRGFGIGDDVFVVGLFHKHTGTKRNIPIVRCGTVAALPEEAVVTREGPIFAYLIEVHSIRGLSGSPVFIHYSPSLTSRTEKCLVGLMHGHWDVKTDRVDDDVFMPTDGELINTGIGIVVPYDRILETIDREDLLRARDARVRMAVSDTLPSSD